MIGITVSVNYYNKLSYVIGNSKFFDEWYFIGDTNNTKKLRNEYPDKWMIILDSNIILPENFNEIIKNTNLDVMALYGMLINAAPKMI
ncbi:hypothetical protein QJ857_gp1252 [Tupanvirus soda lake]|uniref:Uncharacterized protein n=2 Tax=Tupanvirus TaxID=2094720 RepID=A0A6N1NSY9_9VIRU|nr:hypothetical protein QJ857_gp1252 [Tupanvirus soda lake]QKU34806.1 hypothetical protein [Tupanvirus soda lake]